MAARNSTQPTPIDIHLPCGVQGSLDPGTAQEARELGNLFLDVLETALAAQPGVETNGKTLWAVLGTARTLFSAADQADAVMQGGGA